MDARRFRVTFFENTFRAESYRRRRGPFVIPARGESCGANRFVSAVIVAGRSKRLARAFVV